MGKSNDAQGAETRTRIRFTEKLLGSGQSGADLEEMDLISSPILQLIVANYCDISFAELWSRGVTVVTRSTLQLMEGGGPPTPTGRLPLYYAILNELPWHWFSSISGSAGIFKSIDERDWGKGRNQVWNRLGFHPVVCGQLRGIASLALAG
jgi:hypothetical protein